jgi:hypothetical protein
MRWYAFSSSGMDMTILIRSWRLKRPQYEERDPPMQCTFTEHLQSAAFSITVP